MDWISLALRTRLSFLNKDKAKAKDELSALLGERLTELQKEAKDAGNDVPAKASESGSS